MNLNEDKNSVDDESRDSRPDPRSNQKEVHPGQPLGVAKYHIYTHARHALGGHESVKAIYQKLELLGPLQKRILGFLGNFGSGKTEVAVNFAMQLGLAANIENNGVEGPIRIIDLDIINPYFRSREAAEPLTEAGVEVVMPTGDKFWADLPIILPEVKGLIKRTDGKLILDVGGDDLGARVLSHLNQDFPLENTTLMMVVNANRPFTSDLAGARKVLSELEDAAGLKFGGLVSNTHLMDETSPDEIRRGYEFTKKVSAETGLPVLMVTAEPRLIDNGTNSGIRTEEFDCLLLPLYRFMLPPWRRDSIRSG
ncbi:MAG: cobalamin biosynthesis protein CbiA [bacterium]|nr:cobalamin biosynthesis protein CbiA [bacterium]